MIAYLKGRIAEVEDHIAVIEVNGIGYEVNVPLSTAGQLASHSEGETVQIYTYTYVREDQLSLFGFADRDALDLFKLLITVSGIGPKGALGMLSAASTDEICHAIVTEDVKALSRAPGVGKKTAERVILDLKDNVSRIYHPEDPGYEGSGAEEKSGRFAMGEAAQDAVQALVAWGYSRSEAESAVKKCGELADAESYLKNALKYLI